MPIASALNLIPLILQALIDSWLPHPTTISARSARNKARGDDFRPLSAPKPKKGKKNKGKPIEPANPDEPVCPKDDVPVQTSLRVIARDTLIRRYGMRSLAVKHLRGLLATVQVIKLNLNQISVLVFLIFTNFS